MNYDKVYKLGSITLAIIKYINQKMVEEIDPKFIETMQRISFATQEMMSKAHNSQREERLRKKTEMQVPQEPAQSQPEDGFCYVKSFPGDPLEDGESQARVSEAVKDAVEQVKVYPEAIGLVDYRQLEMRVFDGSFSDKLEEAREYAGKGYVASLPHILGLKYERTDDAELWRKRIIANSEEIAAKARNGTMAGHDVVINIHGGGLITDESQIKKLRGFYTTKEGGVYLAQKDIDTLLDVDSKGYGCLQDGTKIRVFDYADFLEDSSRPGFLLEHPRCAVVRDLLYAQIIPTQKVDRIPYANNGLVARAGGVDSAINYSGAVAVNNMGLIVENDLCEISIGRPVGFVLCVRDEQSKQGEWTSTIGTYPLTQMKGTFVGLKN